MKGVRQRMNGGGGGDFFSGELISLEWSQARPIWDASSSFFPLGFPWFKIFLEKIVEEVFWKANRRVCRKEALGVCLQPCMLYDVGFLSGTCTGLAEI